MNQFGHQLRLSIFGESHGAGVGITLDGVPAGLPLDVSDFMPDLLRRQGGNAAGTTPRKESDEPRFLSGLFEGHSTGAPLTIWFANENTRSTDYTRQRQIPRPGHADFVASRTYNGYEDYRGGGHFSGRLTTCLVAAGVVAKKMMAVHGISVQALVTEAGGSPHVAQAVEAAVQEGNSIGGLVECTATGLPVGLGSPFFGSLESQLAAMIFSIPAIKGVEFGAGFAAARMKGSVHNDCLLTTSGITETNHSGGINGGLSNGNPLVVRVAVKPTSSTPAQQKSLNKSTGQVETFAIQGRHDLCIALRVPPVLESAVAFCLADALMQRGLIGPNHAPVAHGGIIYHLCDAQSVQMLQEKGSYSPASYAQEGFIHCCTPQQLEGVLQRYFAGADPPIYRLSLQVQKLESPLRFEWNETLQTHFPHVYGPLNASALWAVDKLYP